MSAVYAIHDVETTIKNKELGDMEAFPFYDENRVVENGLAIGSFDDNELDIELTRLKDKHETISLRSKTDRLIKLIVGHNWKFDLHYLCKHNADIDGIPVRDWIARNHIWDTQSAEYILTGHYNKYPSLDGCAVKYGGTLKDDRIKVMWDAGVQTEDILPEMLSEYLDGDLCNTNIVFKGQLKAAKESGQLPLIRAMNSAVLAYQEMEWNGMKINPVELFARRNFLHKKQTKLINSITTKYLTSNCNNNINHNLTKKINLGSPKQLSVLLFGGDLVYKSNDYQGKYKNGNDKYLICEHTVTNPLYDLSALAQDDWKTKTFAKTGVYSTDDKVLESLLSSLDPESDPYSFIKSLQELRGLDKEISGYYDSIPELLCGDCIVHQNINNTATSTGRLSESNPNLQNVSKKGTSRVKKMFVSRFGDDGLIMEADWKQLEVIGLAFISGCPALRQDILDGKDVHHETWLKVKHLMPSFLRPDEQRRVVKGINFGMIYGGGAKKLAKESGMPVELVKATLKAFYERYPGVKTWQDTLVDELEIQMGDFGKTPKGYPRKQGKLTSITGRKYTFTTFDAPEWLRGVTTSFSPTQLKNYPIQGFATGDVVPTVIGILFRKLLTNPRLKDLCLMINTVHDSIVFDIHKSVLAEAYELIKTITEGAPAILKEVYDIDFDLPLKVDITAGLNWKDQKHTTEWLGVAT